MTKNEDLVDVLDEQLSIQQPRGYETFRQRLGELQGGFSNRRFYHAFALCPRWFDKRRIDTCGFDESRWNMYDPYKVLRNSEYPQLARILMLLSLPSMLSQEHYVDCVNELFRTADVKELILLGRSLAFMPDAELFIDRARENARSNIAPVFSSVAHNSEYALRFFDKGAWNQLVLKAAFLAEPIWCIPGLKQRNNAELVTMLRHYVDERQAAGRSIPWDLWNCIGWRAQTEEQLTDLRKQWRNAGRKTQAAIALSLCENPAPAAKAVGAELAADTPRYSTDELRWPAIADWPD